MLLGLRLDTPANFDASTERLERAIRATWKRNTDRPAIDWGLYDPSALDGPQRRALAFLVRQLQHIAATSPANLATLARFTPVSSLRAAYGAQIQDERTHGALLARYASVIDARHAVRWENRVACEVGRRMQQHPYIGAVAVLMSIEFYATALLDEVLQRVEEPLLHAVLRHIQVDEARHRVLAVEAVQVLHQAGLGSERLTRARLTLCRRVVDFYFSHIIAPSMDRFAGALGLHGREVFERARDEMNDELRQAVH
ncbi:MAG: hypothetical protein ACO3JL_06955 [Myxococcota bacterium]